LAKNLINLSGSTVEVIGIEYSGIRPGEKMYEELLNKEEVHPDEVYEKIYVGRTMDVDFDVVNGLIEQFDQYDSIEMKDALMKIVFTEETLKAVKGS